LEIEISALIIPQKPENTAYNELKSPAKREEQTNINYPATLFPAY